MRYIKLAQIDDVLAAVCLTIQDDAANLGEAQRLAIGEDEGFDGVGLVPTEDDELVGAGLERDDEVAVDVAEANIAGGDTRPEDDAIDPAGISDAVKAIAKTKVVRVVACSARQRIRARTT